MAEPKFIPKPGQTDYTNIRYAPVINCVVIHKGKVLLVQRDKEMRLYPNYWNGISGFLDDQQDIEGKVYEELQEELSIDKPAVKEIQRGQVLLQESPEYNKTWLVVPVLVKIDTKDFKLNWEASRASWFAIEDISSLSLLPGFGQVLAQFL